MLGASGGIGRAFTEHLIAAPQVARVFAFSRGTFDLEDEKLVKGPLDLEREETIAESAQLAGNDGALHLVLVATGILHDGANFQPEKSWRSLDAASLHRSFAINAIGPALAAKYFLPRLPRSGKAIFAALSARVGSIGDNRLGGWYGYRASKAALNMTLKTAAIELARIRSDALCVGLHPGTVDSGLSRPFQGGGSSEALFTAEASGGHMLQVLDGLTAADSGQIFAWDGSRVPA